MPYKLTDKHDQTYGGLQWGEGISHKATGAGKEPCSDGVIHYYDDMWLAVFANPIHANFTNPHLWEFRSTKRVGGDALKSLCKEGTTLRRIPLPEMSVEQRVEIGIRCATLVYKEPKWVEWAGNWLSGKDRTARASRVAEYAASRAAAGAEDAAYAARAAEDAADAAGAAAGAAEDAAYAARAAEDAAYAARAAEDAASRAAAGAEDAAYAARAAEDAAYAARVAEYAASRAAAGAARAAHAADAAARAARAADAADVVKIIHLVCGEEIAEESDVRK